MNCVPKRVPLKIHAPVPVFRPLQEFGGVATQIAVVPYVDRVFITASQLPTFGTLVGSNIRAKWWPVWGVSPKRLFARLLASLRHLQISVSPEEYPDGMKFFNSRTLLGRKDDDDLQNVLARRLAEDVL